MSAHNGSSDEMDDETPQFLDLRDPLQLDDGTVDRLLDGLPVDDAPPRYRGVVSVLTALRAPATAAELEGERQAVAMLTTRFGPRAPVSTIPSRSTITVKRKHRFRKTGAVLVGSATLFVGLGAAGALPGAAQSVASDMLGTVGVSVPSPDSHAGDHPNERGRSGGASDATTTGATSGESGKGATISGLATDPSTTGLDNGGTVSSTASDDQSHAGEQGGKPSDAGTPPESPGNAPAVTPNPGGPPADNGNPNPGQPQGDDASGGRSSEGSGNADAGLGNKP